MAPNIHRDTNLVHRQTNGISSPKKEMSTVRRTPSPKKIKSNSRSSSSSSSCSNHIQISWLTILSVFCFISGFLFYLAPLERILFNDLPKCASEKEEFGYLARTTDHNDKVKLHHVPCHLPGYRRERLLKSAPQKCGTLIYDELVPMDDALELRKMAAKLVYEMGETNPFSRESLNLHWVNLHHLFRKGYKLGIFNDTEFGIIKRTSERAKTVVAETFGLPRDNLYFTTVAQFTRYRPMTRYSQFRHVDKVRSQSLVVTSILWLSTYDYDFGGGTTAFLTGPKPFMPMLVEPKVNRFAAWTSGWENPHEVMQILWGERLAIIFAFTVNPYLGERDMDSMKNWSQTAPENPFLG